MADLPSTPITKLNDLEVAGDKPHTETLMRKIGIDINGLIDADAAQDTLISANAAAITALSVQTSTGTMPNGAGTIHTFSASPGAVVIFVEDATPTAVNEDKCAVVIPGTTSNITVNSGGVDRNIALTLSGATLSAGAGSVNTLSYRLIGHY